MDIIILVGVVGIGVGYWVGWQRCTKLAKERLEIHTKMWNDHFAEAHKRWQTADNRAADAEFKLNKFLKTTNGGAGYFGKPNES